MLDKYNMKFTDIDKFNQFYKRNMANQIPMEQQELYIQIIMS